jgi:two-component system, sensor histidine kinase PdtaS
MNRLVLTAIFMVMAATSFGQNISKDEADSLLKSLASIKTNNDRIDVYFKLAQYHLFKTGEYQTDLDSAKDFIDKATVLNAKISSADTHGLLIFIRSLFAREKGQIREGRILVDSALNLLKNGKNKYYLGRAYFALSEYYDYSNPNESAEKIRLVELACKALGQSGDVALHAFTLTFLADLYQLNDENDKALSTLDTALALYQSIGYKKLQSVYALYSAIYYGDKYFRQSLHYSLLALQSAESDGDTSMTLCQINNYIGMAYLQSKEYENAIPYFRNSLKIAEKYGDNNSSLALMMNIVQNYIELNKPEQALAFMKTYPQKQKTEPNYIQTPLAWLTIYNELKRYSEAKPYADELIQLSKQFNTNPRVLSNVYYMISKYYLDSKQYQSARIFNRKSDSTNTIGNSAVRRWANLLIKFRLDTAFGNYNSAIENLIAYQKLKDSLYNETTTRQIKQLEIEYETEKNKNEITVLNQKNQLAQNNLDRTMLVKNFTIAGIGLLGIILGLLYWQYWNKQKSNKVILQKNSQLEHYLAEKEWLVKEIHHRVKNNFHIVASLLEIQSSYLKNKEALSAIKESQHRIHSMSIIHQKLYQSETLSTIHMPEYIYELVEYLRESFAIRENIGFSLQIEKIELNHASAITLGLILNEAITNAIKYAFTEKDGGQISISLKHIFDSQLLLSIADNGGGLPTDFKTKIGASMGMELLQGLTDDLGGTFQIETNEGTHIKVIFNYIPIAAEKVSFS